MEADSEPQQTSRKSSSQSAGQGRAVSLKRVESLVSEGEKLAFVFEPVSKIWCTIAQQIVDYFLID